MYVANNLSIFVLLFCIDSIVDLTMHIKFTYYIMYNIKIIYNNTMLATKYAYNYI